ATAGRNELLVGQRRGRRGDSRPAAPGRQNPSHGEPFNAAPLGPETFRAAVAAPAPGRGPTPCYTPRITRQQDHRQCHSKNPKPRQQSGATSRPIVESRHERHHEFPTTPRRELRRAFIVDLARYAEGVLSEKWVKEKYRFDDTTREKLGDDDRR